MPKGNIIISTLNKLRPGNDKGFRGISIVDTAHEQRQRSKSVTQIFVDRSQPDPEGTSYPVAVVASNVPPRYPSGVLSRADPKTGDLPPYEADDDEVITRIFGVNTIYYNRERRDV